MGGSPAFNRGRGTRWDFVPEKGVNSGVLWGGGEAATPQNTLFLSSRAHEVERCWPPRLSVELPNGQGGGLFPRRTIYG